MNRRIELTDALLRDALTPPGDVVAPAGLLDSISTGLSTASQRSGLGRWLPGGLARPIWRPVDWRLAWAFAAAALLVTLVLGTLVAGGLLEDRRLADEPRVVPGPSPAPEASVVTAPPLVELTPTDVEVLSPEGTGYYDVVADGLGAAWALGAGHVTQFDPTTGVRRTWAVRDDRAFQQGALAAATGGGIWLWDGSAIRRFDGAGLRERVPVPYRDVPPPFVREAEPGTLWVTWPWGGVSRWDGATWTDLDGPRDCFALAMPTDGDPWFMCGTNGSPTLSHLVDGGWVTFDRSATPALDPGYGKALAAGSDGSVWIAASGAVGHWSGGTWTTTDGPGFDIQALAVADDGAVWMLSGERLPRIAVLRGSGWQWLAAPGMPGEVPYEIAALGQQVFVGTDAGLYRYDASGWVSAWVDPAVGPSISFGPGRSLVAVSADEAWALDQRGVWHFADGRWKGPDRPAELASDVYLRSLAVTPDGATMAIATDRGIAVRKGGAWSMTPTTGWAGDLIFDPDGSIWVAAGADRLVHLVETPAGWDPVRIGCHAGGMVLAVEPDGTVWTGGIGYSGTAGLARLRDGRCEQVHPLQDAPEATVDVVDLAVDPTGGIVAAVLETKANPPWQQWVLHSDHDRWTALRGPDPVDRWTGDLAVDPRGRVWLQSMASQARLERYEDGAWTEDQGGAALGRGSMSQLSFAPDGTLWLVGPSGVQRVRPGVLD